MNLPIRRFRLLLFCFLLIAGVHVQATHIVGAELTYECLNEQTNTYRIRLRMLRDCQLGEAPFDDVVNLYAFSSANPANFRVFPINKPPVTPPVVPTQWNQCVGTPYNLCVEEAIYQAVITLQPIAGGYDFAWARCCRNSNIDNLFQPLNQGVTFLAHLPGPEDAVCNSMPVFNATLPTFICVGEDFHFDHSATDPDGDSLVYMLSRPYTGLNLFGQGAGNPSAGGPQPVVDNTNPMGPPPYAFVTYNGGQYSPGNPFGPNSAAIDPASGWIHINAPSIGVYVIAVSVFEYRNGVLLSENKIDLQVHVISCLPQNQPPTISHTFSPTDSVRGDTLVVSVSDTTCYRITITDPDTNAVLSVQPISFIFNSLYPPSYTISGSNPLFVDLCWEGGCEFAGDLVEIILMGYDDNNCPVYNPAFDTVVVEILPPPPAFPVIGHQLPPTNPLGPDTLLVEVDSLGCFDVWVLDTSGLNSAVHYIPTVEDALTGQAVSFSMSTTAVEPDSLGLNICFPASCENRDRLFRFVLTATLTDACPPNNTASDTLYLYVSFPPNPPPLVNPDLTQAPLFDADTILIDVHDELCLRFSVDDTVEGLGLDHDVRLETMTGQAVGGIPPVVQQLSSNDSLLVSVCWTPSCAQVDGLFRLVLTGTQLNACEQSASARDTIYIRVNDVTNPPPVIDHQILPGFAFSGDTLLITPDSAACFAFTLRDTGQNTFLEMDFEAQVMGSGQSTLHGFSVDISAQTDTLLAGEACFTPGCSYLGQTLLVRLTGRDTFDCNPSNWVYDTLFVRVIEPYNRPPVVTHDLGGLPAVGNVVTVTPRSEPFCYRVVVTDPDSAFASLAAQGSSDVFDAWFRYGNPGEIFISGTNPLQVEVCWAPSCYDSGKSFELVICGRDTSRCGLTPEVCDTVVFEVGECNIEVQNVFSPNGDGLNDAFVPYNMAGVDFYHMEIFDRWGVRVFSGESATWNGTLGGNGKPVPEGVYYFIFEYRYFSAKGVPLKERFVGTVTLVR